MGDWTIDEEMFRERLRTVADSLDAFAVASLLRDASVSLNEHDRQIVRQQAEIERLRAENRRLTDENARAWNACNEECQRKEELQALIDALYRAEMMPGNRSTNPAWWAAIDALLAAATKEDDRD